ncbi:MAG: homocysteine S-methyltransferase family protein [Eubacteriales bacterium]
MAHPLFEKEFVLLDGAFGTQIQAKGLKLGEIPELLNFTQPKLIQSIYQSYLEAGSDLIFANTFGANPHKLEGSGYTAAQVVAQGVKLAKESASEFENRYVALDIGPIGTLLEPSGSLSFEDAYEMFREMIVAGAEAGADVVIMETMTDLYEVKAGILACREHCDLPLLVTMTFEENRRTFTGCSVEAMAITLQGLGVDALGFNCSLGPQELYPMMEELATYTDLPLIIKPNAGLPHPETGEYTLTSEVFGDWMGKLRGLGVQFLGGCCGTTPQFIQELHRILPTITPTRPDYAPMTKVCSATSVVTVDTVRVIGERINPTGKKRFAQALEHGEMSYILTQALEQAEAGAEILDVNVGVPQLDEVALMKRVVKELQSVVTLPLQIDSSDIAAMEAGLRVYNGKPILNSVNGESANLEAILPLAKKYGAVVIGLTMNEEGIPKTAQKRIEIALKILKRAQEFGIPKQDVVIDCLALTVSAQQKDCLETLEAMEFLQREHGLNLVLGVSNISFGLPNRELMNHSFLSMAMARGLTLPILNPNAKPMMDAVFAHRVLTGFDTDSTDYIARFANTNVQTIVAPQGEEMTLEHAILKGLPDQSQQQVAILLESVPPMDIINQTLIPTLDLVGKKFETGEFFLPQLLRSATASLAAFELIKKQLATSSEEMISRGKILLATVHGDVHDIGKNIVKVVLENYGYQIFDLGKDVPPERVVSLAQEENISLIGLSALMTTTVVSMARTIELLRESGHPCQIMVGGAVLTPDYAKKIGADFYAKDAKASADIAKEVFS